jgi:integrase
MAYSSIKLYRKISNNVKSVVVYYKQKTTLRHLTTVAVKEKDFDKKAGRVKPTDKEYEQKNEIIQRAHEQIESTIVSYVKEHAVKPDCDYVKKQIKLNTDAVKIKSGSELTDYYQKFLQEKTIFFANPDRSKQSLKDYQSTFNALLDYQRVVKSIPLNALVDNIWLEQFNQFLSKERPAVAGYTFLSSKQGAKTRHKRFICLKNFGNWLVSKNHLPSVEVLSKFRIRVEDNNHYALTLDEMKLLQDKIFKRETHQKAIDVFLFACHTGLRISDVKQLKKSMVKNKKGNTVLELNTQKTKAKAEVPISRLALHILDKYNYNLRLFSEQKLNKYIHEALQTIDEFNEYYVYGTRNEDAPKHELITFHTGRRTFITNLVNNNVNLNAIMKMTGHKKISTLQEYINPDYELITENIKIFNDLY